MAALSIALASCIPIVRSNPWRPIRSMPARISCIGWVLFLLCVCEFSLFWNFKFIIVYNFKFLWISFFLLPRKDPEGILGPPKTGHIARQEFKRRLERDAEAREEFERQVREDKERRQALRNVIWINGFVFSWLGCRHFHNFNGYCAYRFLCGCFVYSSLGLFRILLQSWLSIFLTLKHKRLSSRLQGWGPG